MQWGKKPCLDFICIIVVDLAKGCFEMEEIPNQSYFQEQKSD